MKKKFPLLIMLLILFLIQGCSNTHQNEINTYGVMVNECSDEEMIECGEYIDLDMKLDNKIKKIDFEMQKELLLKLFKNKDIIIIENSDKNINEIDFKISESCNNNTYDISLGLGVNGEYSNNEKDAIIQNRIKSLNDFLKEESKTQESINIILRFMGVKDLGAQKITQTDYLEFQIGKGCSAQEGKMLYEISIDHTKQKIKILYYKGKSENKKIENITYSDFINDISSKIAEKVKNSSNETYFFNHLTSNQILKNKSDNYKTVIIYDFFFDIHPNEIEYIKKRGVNHSNYQSIDTKYYKFNNENLINYRGNGNMLFDSLYRNDIFQIIPSLKDICSNNQSLYLIGINEINNQIVAEKLKNYYENILFNGCKIQFK